MVSSFLGRKLKGGFIYLGDIELGSNETINYALWLQSKWQKRDYYELVLESVKG
ncbi:MAG: hypothetical protein R3E32_28745 [Chitinophagales bacterium]